MPDINTLKSYCHIPADDPVDPVLQLCYDAAIEYMADAGVDPPETTVARYDLCVYMLAGTWFDARGMYTIGQVPAPLARSVSSIILQLRKGAIT